MAKSVLGNDPFQTAAVVSEKPQAKKKNATAKKSVQKSEKAKESASKTASKPKKKSVTKKTKVAPKKVAKPAAKANGKKKNQAPETKTTVAKKTAKAAPGKTPKKTDKKNIDKSSVISVAASNKITDTNDADLRAMLRPEDFTVGQEYGFDPEFRKKINPLLDLLYRIFWRVDVKGVENIPENGKAVLVSNHAGILPFDGLILNAAIRKKTGREVWPLIEDFFYYAPVLGSILSKAGCVRACQANAQRLLGEEELVAVFPEGIKGIVKPYRNRYRLQRFGRGGFVKLCLHTDSPVIPVAIVGSEESHPMLFNLNSIAKLFKLPYFPVTPLFPLLGPLGLIPLPNKWSIVIGEPLYINQFGPETAGDRVAVNRLSAKIKSQIQKMIDMEIGQRHSRWR